MFDLFSRSAPKPEDIKHAYKMLRPRADVPAIGVFLIDEPVRAYTHWFNNRTYPCGGGSEDCLACRQGSVPDFHCYSWLLQHPQEVIRILALPRAPAAQLCDHAATYGSLRGVWIEATRVGKTDRSAVAFRLFRCDAHDGPLPEVPDLKGTLLRIWGVSKPPPANDTDLGC